MHGYHLVVRLDVVICELSRKDLVTTEGWTVVIFYVYYLELHEPAWGRDGGLTRIRRILLCNQLVLLYVGS